MCTYLRGNVLQPFLKCISSAKLLAKFSAVGTKAWINYGKDTSNYHEMKLKVKKKISIIRCKVSSFCKPTEYEILKIVGIIVCRTKLLIRAKTNELRDASGIFLVSHESPEHVQTSIWKLNFLMMMLSESSQTFFIKFLDASHFCLRLIFISLKGMCHAKP